MSDLGGADISAAKKSIVRRVATLEVELERMELAFATATAQPSDIDLYQRTSNTLRRHLETLGLERSARDITPTFDSYISSAAEIQHG